jgi:PPOX class probable F420-dependent enzyme
MRLTEELAAALLERWPVARMATLTRDGAPHQVPIVFASHAGQLWSPIDAKPKRPGALARARNLRGRPELTLLLDHYDRDWERLWWLRVDGLGEVVLESRGGSDFAQAALRIREKYPQYRRLPLFDERPRLLRIAVERVRSWCAGPAALEAASGWLARQLPLIPSR